VRLEAKLEEVSFMVDVQKMKAKHYQKQNLWMMITFALCICIGLIAGVFPKIKESSLGYEPLPVIVNVTNNQSVQNDQTTPELISN